jgi:hypothetical protein
LQKAPRAAQVSRVDAPQAGRIEARVRRHDDADGMFDALFP